MIHWNYTKYILVWLIGLIIFLIITLSMLQIQSTNELVLFGMGYGLLVTGIYLGVKKQKFRFPTFLFIIGLNMTLIAGGLLFGNLVLTNVDKTLWWEVPSITDKTYLGIITFMGFLLMVFTGKATLANWYWWGRKR